MPRTDTWKCQFCRSVKPLCHVGLYPWSLWYSWKRIDRYNGQKRSSFFTNQWRSRLRFVMSCKKSFGIIPGHRYHQQMSFDMWGIPRVLGSCRKFHENPKSTSVDFAKAYIRPLRRELCAPFVVYFGRLTHSCQAPGVFPGDFERNVRVFTVSTTGAPSALTIVSPRACVKADRKGKNTIRGAQNRHQVGDFDNLYFWNGFFFFCIKTAAHLSRPFMYSY